jgi:chemotaxis signal transduction protein/chemotaxis methyl-accepting protein methylase
MAEARPDVNNVATRKESVAHVDYKAVTFTLAGKDYGVDIMSVREISRGGRFTYVPNTPHFVRGVYNLRGEIIPVVDLRDFFGLPVNKKEKVEGILICRVKDTTLGLVVDSIEKVIGINRNYIQPAHPMFAEINIQYIEGIIDREDRLYVLLNIHQIFGIAKELLDDDEWVEKEDPTKSVPVAIAEPVAAVATPAPAAVAPAPVAPKPAASPAAAPKPVAPKAAPVQVANPAPFIEPMPEPVANSSPSAESQALLDMLNAMPEPSGEMLLQPDVESLLSGSKAFSNRPVFNGDAQTLDRLISQLEDLTDFKVGDINQDWIIQQANTYIKHHTSLDFEDEDDALKFLKGFFSEATGALWSGAMMQELASKLSPREKGIYHVWNPGCDTGHESYSILMALLTEGITTTPKIYAQDINLIAISKAPHLSFAKKDIPQNADILTTEGNHGLQFKNEYKNFILFEFADVTSKNTFPGVDLIVARDTLSFLSPEEIDKFLEDAESADIGSIMVLGDHENLQSDTWKSIEGKHLSFYKKIK